MSALPPLPPDPPFASGTLLIATHPLLGFGLRPVCDGHVFEAISASVPSGWGSGQEVVVRCLVDEWVPAPVDAGWFSRATEADILACCHAVDGLIEKLGRNIFGLRSRMLGEPLAIRNFE